MEQIDQVILFHDGHKTEQLQPTVAIFYGNGMGVGGGVGRPGTTAYLHGRLTAAASWCQAGSTFIGWGCVMSQQHSNGRLAWH